MLCPQPLETLSHRSPFSHHSPLRNLRNLNALSHPALVNGQPVNYASTRVDDSPFLKSDFGTGIVTIQKGNKELVLNFNQ